MSKAPADKRPCPSISNAKSIESADRPGAILTEDMIAGFDLLPGSIMAADSNGVILYVNPQGLESTGYSSDE